MVAVNIGRRDRQPGLHRLRREQHFGHEQDSTGEQIADRVHRRDQGFVENVCRSLALIQRARDQSRALFVLKSHHGVVNLLEDLLLAGLALLFKRLSIVLFQVFDGADPHPVTAVTGPPGRFVRRTAQDLTGVGAIASPVAIDRIDGAFDVFGWRLRAQAAQIKEKLLSVNPGRTDLHVLVYTLGDFFDRTSLQHVVVHAELKRTAAGIGEVTRTLRADAEQIGILNLQVSGCDDQFLLPESLRVFSERVTPPVVNLHAGIAATQLPQFQDVGD